MTTLATMVEYRMLFFLGIGQFLKIVRYYEILPQPSVGKSLNVYYLKTTGRRAKQMKIWDLWSC